MSRVFISYSHKDKQWRDCLVEQLGVLAGERLLSIWHDGLIGAGAMWLQEIEEALAGSRVAVLLVSAAFLNSGFIRRQEVPLLLERRRKEGMHVVPVIVSPCPWRSVPWLAALQARPLAGKTLAELSKAGYQKVLADLAGEILQLVPPPDPPPPPPPPPMPIKEPAPRSVVFDSPKPLPNQEFAIELLTEPIVLRRDASGLRIIINRDNVTEALFTTAGKRKLCRKKLGSPERLDAVRALDREIHEFLLGVSKKAELVVHLDQLPLRWASGGVLSVVRWQDRLWTPFFFRDIPPFGWNIALGSSERTDDLNDPWTFLVREFLEETLVLDRDIPAGDEINHKPFVFGKLDVAREVEIARRFAAEHVHARLRSDGLDIRLRQEGLPDGLDRRLCVVANDRETGVDVLVKKQGSKPQTTPDVLVAINPLELGIEVVKVLRYSLADGDYILDGETLTRDGKPELVRMFVALISHDYLREVFCRHPLPESSAGIQPSIKAPGIPATELRLYPYDLLRRREIARGNAPRSSPWERKRYAGWLERFGDLFFDEAGGIRSAHERALFTPTSAKILSYYFAGPGKVAG